MTDIKSMTERQLADFFKNMGQPAFRAKQVFTWRTGACAPLTR